MGREHGHADNTDHEKFTSHIKPVQYGLALSVCERCYKSHG